LKRTGYNDQETLDPERNDSSFGAVAAA